MSSRDIVRSIMIIGSASLLSILIGIIRVKVLAVLLGPTGIGVLGIFTNIQTTASQLAGMGLGISGVRQLAASSDDPAALSRVRRALLAANLALGTAGMLVVWLLRERLAHWIFEDPSRAGDVGLLGVGVLLSLIAGSQVALLQGLRRIGDLARVTVLGALVATVAGIGVVWTLGSDGIIWFVVLASAANVFVVFWFTARLPRPVATRMGLMEWVAQWRAMFSLGVTFMLGGVLLALGLLIVRTLIVRELGLEAAGYFQASWAISAQYVGLILGAMGADYFPRLSGIIEDRERSNELVNTQAQISLLLAGPALLAMLALAPWVIELLYSAEFQPAVELLRWQTLGNILKVLSWSVGFILIARARGRVFFLTELLSNILYLLMVWVAIPIAGLSGAGIAFFANYAFYLFLVTAVAARVHGFRWQRETIVLAVILLGTAGAVHVLSYASTLGAAYIGVALALGMGVFNLRAIVRKTGTQGRLGSKVARVYRLVGWPVE